MPIFHSYYGFLLNLNDAYRKFPKQERYTIGVKTMNLAIELYIILLRANNERPYRRLALLREASISLDVLKILLRLAKDARAVSEKQYINLQGRLMTVGKMLGGWIKSLDAKNPA